MELKDRIRLLRGKESQASFGERFGVNQTTVSRWEKGAAPSKEELLELARLAGVPVEEFLAGDGNIPEGLPPRPAKPASSPSPGLSLISEVDVRSGAGGGGVDSLELTRTDEWGNHIAADAVRTDWGVPTDYVRYELRIAPAKTRIIEVIGDSMSPTLESGDRVMVNLADVIPSPGGVFVLWDGLGVVVKRLEYIPGSDPIAIKIISDNPNHNTYERTVEEIRIIGRAVWFGRRM